jgi:hypothetical protein
MPGPGDRFPTAVHVRDEHPEVPVTDVQTQAWLDQEDARVTQAIRRRGWFIQYVLSCRRTMPGGDRGHLEDPPFAYTVGLFGMGHPELLIVGVSPITASSVLDALGERIRAGADIVPGELITSEDWQRRIIAEQVPNPGEIVFAANRHYWRPPEHSVPVLQLSYDDEAGRFPWERGHAEPATQPRPGTFRA